jgi:hypothetical protein
MNKSTAHQTVLVSSLQTDVHVNITQLTDRTAKCQRLAGATLQLGTVTAACRQNHPVAYAAHTKNT